MLFQGGLWCPCTKRHHSPENHKHVVRVDPIKDHAGLIDLKQISFGHDLCHSTNLEGDCDTTEELFLQSNGLPQTFIELLSKMHDGMTTGKCTSFILGKTCLVKVHITAKQADVRAARK